MSVINGANNTVTATIDVGVSPTAIAVDPTPIPSTSSTLELVMGQPRCR